MNTEKDYNADEVGILRMDMEPRDVVKAGDVGYLISGIKKAAEVKVGDTITQTNDQCQDVVQGFEDVKPMVFAGIYPVDTDDFEELRSIYGKITIK